MKKEAQFTLQDIVPIVGIFVVAGIFVGYGLKIMGDVKGTMTASSVEANATGDFIAGVGKLSSNAPTLGLIAAAVIIIGMLGYIAYQKR